MPNLHLNGVMMRYTTTEEAVLQIPALRLSHGERVAVMGPSGSGKTTLINILCGLEKATQGKVLWNETDIGALSSAARDNWRARHVGLIMQDFHLYPGLNARENVLLPARFRHWRLPAALKQRAAALLERVGVNTGKRPAEYLSRGEMQRVAVARALLAEPSILIADEPTASLDATNGAQVIDLLLALAAEQGTTLIAVTHDHRLADRMPRRLMLKNGHLTDRAEKTGEQA